MESSRLVAVTVIGRDRPGIVARVTEVLYELGCNLEDVSSTILRGHFSMLMVIRAPADVGLERLDGELARAAADLELLVNARPVEEATGEVAPPTHMVSVYGGDKPGIVFNVARVLASRGANITDLTSRVIGSEGEPVYALMLEVSTDDPARLQEDLGALRDRLAVEVTVHPIEADVL